MTAEPRGNASDFFAPSSRDRMPTAPKTAASLDQRIQPKFLERVNIMANNNLQGKKIAILVADGFEQVELLEPRKALDKAGATTQVVSPASKKVKGWNTKEWGNEVPVDVSLDSANPQNFDALLLPGGVMNPDHLRM